MCVCGGGEFQSLVAELEKALQPNCFWVDPHLKYEGETEKMVNEIAVVHSEDSALEDIVELSHRSSYPPVED